MVPAEFESLMTLGIASYAPKYMYLRIQSVESIQAVVLSKKFKMSPGEH